MLTGDVIKLKEEKAKKRKAKSKKEDIDLFGDIEKKNKKTKKKGK